MLLANFSKLSKKLNLNPVAHNYAVGIMKSPSNICFCGEIREIYAYHSLSTAMIYFQTNTIFTLSIQTPKLLTILVPKFEQVQFTTRCCV